VANINGRIVVQADPDINVRPILKIMKAKRAGV
jgi:hypothetical protein